MTVKLAHAESDDQAIARMTAVIETHCNSTDWYNNASFALPLLAAMVVAVAGLVLRNRDVLAFAAFLGVVTLGMIPVVLVSWRQTATAVVLTGTGITALHSGRVLKWLPWSEVQAITRRETQGNVRWFVSGGEGERLALDGELENLDRLIETARRLSSMQGDTREAR